MTDRRRKIAALRAKADSTTFPAEAEALRAKADDLEATLRAGEPGARPFYSYDDDDRFDWTKVTRQGQSVNWTVTGFRIPTTGDVFTAAGGWMPNLTQDDLQRMREREGKWMTVTDVNGQTHRERIY